MPHENEESIPGSSVRAKLSIPIIFASSFPSIGGRRCALCLLRARLVFPRPKIVLTAFHKHRRKGESEPLTLHDFFFAFPGAE
jgi:hypothetical protein